MPFIWYNQYEFKNIHSFIPAFEMNSNDFSSEAPLLTCLSFSHELTHWGFLCLFYVFLCEIKSL